MGHGRRVSIHGLDRAQAFREATSFHSRANRIGRVVTARPGPMFRAVNPRAPDRSAPLTPASGDSNGSGANKFEWDVTLHGPIFALAIEF